MPKTQDAASAGESPTGVNVTAILALIGVGKCPTIDLHGKRAHEVESTILDGISKAIIANHDIILITHGFNGGTTLRSATHRVLGILKESRQVKDFSLLENNPGQTFVRL